MRTPASPAMRSRAVACSRRSKQAREPAACRSWCASISISTRREFSGIGASMRLRFVLACACVAMLGCSDDETVNPVSGPGGDIHLVRDSLGITHVYAESDGDAFFGAGYAMARDRLFQMELTRRGAFGTESELAGSGGLGNDIAARTMNFKKLGEQDAARQAKERPDEAKLAQAWCDGVNKRIAEIASGAVPRPYGMGAKELDFVPDPWTIAD